MVKKTYKTSEQMIKELEDAMEVVSEKLETLLYNGNYAITDIFRSPYSHELEYAHIQVGKHEIKLRAGNGREGTELQLMLPKNPVNPKLIEKFDVLDIEQKLDTYKTLIAGLEKRKQELMMLQTDDDASSPS